MYCKTWHMVSWNRFFCFVFFKAMISDASIKCPRWLGIDNEEMWLRSATVGQSKESRYKASTKQHPIDWGIQWNNTWWVWQGLKTIMALTPAVMKCFERLIKDLICFSLLSMLDPLQFAHHVLHTTLSHIDIGRGNYVTLLFIDHSSAFNTIVPLRLFSNLRVLGLCSSLYHFTA